MLTSLCDKRHSYFASRDQNSDKVWELIFSVVLKRSHVFYVEVCFIEFLGHHAIHFIFLNWFKTCFASELTLLLKSKCNVLFLFPVWTKNPFDRECPDSLLSTLLWSIFAIELKVRVNECHHFLIIFQGTHVDKCHIPIQAREILSILCQFP